MIFERIADFIMKNAKIIIVVWIVALLISTPFILKYNSVLQYDMDKMQTSSPLESVKGQEILSSEEFNSGGGLNGGTIILIEAYDSVASDIASVIKHNLDENVYFWDYNEKLRSQYGIDCEVTIKQLGRFDDKYFADKETQMIVYIVNYPTLPDDAPKVKNSTFVPDIRSIVKDSTSSVDGIVRTYVTGTDAISYDTSTGSTNDIKHIDPISILLVLILIGLFFKSFVTAGTPPVIIGMAYGVLLALVYAIGSVMGIYYITTILVLVSMLGAGCDYCIFIISRYREERKEDKPHHEALRESIIWAGESIITSGISVIIGFGSLMLCSFSLVSTMGMILALGILLALLAALTFVPSVLMLVGDRIFWPSKVASYQEGSKAMQGWYGKCARLGHKYFTHSAKSAIKYAKIILVVTILITAPLAYVAITSNASYDMIGAMPSGEGKDGVSIISENVGGGMLMPTNISMKVNAFVDLNVGGGLESGDLVPQDAEVTFLAEPRTGHIVKGWVVDSKYYTETDAMDGVTISTDKTECTVSSGHTVGKNVSPVYDKATFTVTYTTDDVAKGTISATDDGKMLISGFPVDYGSKLKFTAAPKDGYHVDHWVIVRNSIPETIYSHDTELSIDRASYDYTIAVVFEADTTATYKVNFNSPEHGRLVVRADDNVINSGADVAARAHIVITAIADSGYVLDSLTVDGPAYVSGEIPFLTEDATITATFKPAPVENYIVTFSSDDVSKGTVSATSNGNAISSGTAVDPKSKVVITATPAEGMVVIAWIYTIDVGGSPIDVPSYVSKTEHTITSINSNQTVKVVFGVKGSSTVNVTANDPASNGSIYMMLNDAVIENGPVAVGSDLFFTAKVDEGYHVSKWIVNGIDVNTTSKNYTLYDIGEDTTITFETAADSFIPIYFSNDDSMGTLQVSCDQINIPYSERANAIAMMTSFNQLSQDLMNMETDGKKNVAIAIGPINGDILFDGEHEWVFDTIWNILPDEYKSLIGAGHTYDALIYAWNMLPYEIQQALNYYLTYKLGFVSDVFTEHEGGPEFQYVKFMVVTRDEPMSALSVDTIKQVYDKKDQYVQDNSADNGGFVYEAYISGAAVSNYELSELVNKDFHFIIVIVIVLLILLLFFVMKSYFTPIRAVATIVMSVVWTLGLTYILFEHILGMPVVWIVPIVLFVVCLGLGMDYDILLTTRVKECVMKGHSNDDAIIEAVQKSGAIITLCGLIMAGAFGTMMMSSSPMLMEFGFALGFAIAVDALVIRTYIVPAIMHLMGDWNWKGPNYDRIKNGLFRKKTEE